MTAVADLLAELAQSSWPGVIGLDTFQIETVLNETPSFVTKSCARKRLTFSAAIFRSSQRQCLRRLA
jgi:hypothetical protein